MIKNELRIMRGPNMWSVHPNIIVLKIDYSSISHIAINKIFQWQNSQGFISRSREDIDKEPKMFLTELIAVLAKNLQPDSAFLFSDTKLINEGSYYAIIEYKEEKAGVAAAKSALEIVQTVLKKGKYEALEEIKTDIAAIVKAQFPGPSTSAIIEAAKERGIPVRKSAGGNFVFGYGKYQKKISASICGTTSDIAVSIAGDKAITKQLLEEAMIPVPAGFVISKKKSIKKLLPEIKFPVVVKPLNSNQGKGITSGITDETNLADAFRLAKKHSHYVIIEKQIEGNDFRFLMVNNKLIAAAQRTAACVKGDGKSTIRELVDKLNQDPLRGDGHQNVLTKILIDESTVKLLEAKGMTVDSIPEKGDCIFLKDTANLSTGGTAVDVTDEVHPDNILLAERVASIVGLDVCGIDIMAANVSSPISENGGAILEVNAAPGLRMHFAPSSGTPRNVGAPIIDMLFPDRKFRVPIVAVTGTNGKTTTCRLMAHMSSWEGYKTGLTTTDGVYLNNALIQKGDCSGPQSAKLILQEPATEFAVLECARGGIIRQGLAFQQCDIAIVTNVASDHLGLKDIHTLEDLAAVKAVVPRSVKEDGYAILNAADNLVYGMKDHLKCNIGLFCLDEKNPRIAEHVSNGGCAAVVNEQKEIVILNGDEKIVIDAVKNIPLTMNGKADFMTENILPVVLAAYLMKFNVERIKKSLLDFKPSAEQTPGRMNHYDINGVTVIVDYAHNPHGLNALARYLKNVGAPTTGIITAVGDRRSEDVIEIGKAAAEMFDDVIIRFDKDMRGRTQDEISTLIIQGLKQVNPMINYKVIPEINDALKQALDEAKPDSYIVLTAEDVRGAIDLVAELKKSKQTEDTAAA